jgi:RecA-family ATPase
MYPEKPIVQVSVSDSGIPAELKILPRWVLWRYLWSKKTRRWVKFPFQPSGSPASSTDPGAWGDYNSVYSAYAMGHANADGIGFVLNGDGIVGIDIDGAIDDNGQWSDLSQQVLAAIDGYAEISPSGAGCHLITRANLAHSYVKAGLEIYPSQRYLTFTGSRINAHRHIPQTHQDLSAIITHHFDKIPISQPSSPGEILLDAPIIPPLDRTPDQLRATLQYIDTPDHEPEATRLIWAIHHQYQGAAAGLALAHEVCSGSIKGAAIPHPKYSRDYVDERWARANNEKDGAISWRTIERTARANGWDLAPSIPADIDRDSPKLAFIKDTTFIKGFEDSKYIIRDVLPQAQVGVIYGASGSGKTFFAIDMAYKIQRGIDWYGKKTHRADVFYIAAESAGSVKRRVAAWIQHYGEGDGPWLIDHQPNLMTVEAIHNIATAIQACSETPGVIFVDTLAMSHEGDENSSKDMTIYIRQCQALALTTGAMVILVHHTGKDDARGMRGSSVLYANSDAVFEISADSETGQRTMVVDKLKDGETGATYGFTLNKIIIGYCEDNEEIISCYIQETSINSEPQYSKKQVEQLSAFDTAPQFDNARKYLEIISDLINFEKCDIKESDIIEAIQKNKRFNPFEYSNTPRPYNIRRVLMTLASANKIYKDGNYIKLK